MNNESILAKYFDRSGNNNGWRKIRFKLSRKKITASFTALLLLFTSFYGAKTARADKIGSMFCLQTIGTAATTTVIKNGTNCLITFSASTKWRVPSGVESIDFLMVGGGGGGSSDGGGGGGGGGGIEAFGISVTPGTLADVIVGTGGASSTNGSPTKLDLNGDSTYEWNVSGGNAGEGWVTRNGGTGGASVDAAFASTSWAGGHGGHGPTNTASGVDANNLDLGEGFQSGFTGTNYYYGGGGGGGIGAQSGGDNNSTFGRKRGGYGGGGAGAVQLSTTDTALNRDVAWSYQLDGTNLYEQVNLQANCLADDSGKAHASKGFPGLNGTGGGGGGGAANGDGCSNGTSPDDDGERTVGGRGGDGVVFIRYVFSGNDTTYNDICNQTVGAPDALSVSLTNGNCVLTFSANSTNWTIPTGVSLVRVLLVGGGAGGKNDGGGGGGGGGVISASSVGVTPGTVARFTVGAGGSADSGIAGDTKISFDGDTNYEWIAGGGQLGICYTCGRDGGNSGAVTFPSGFGATSSTTSSGHGGRGSIEQTSKRPAANTSLGNGVLSDITGTNLYYGGGGGGGISGGTTSDTRKTEINGGVGGFGGGGAGATQRERGATFTIKYKVDGLFGTKYQQSLTAVCVGSPSNAQGMTMGFPGLDGFGGGGGGGAAFGDGCAGNPSGNDGERTDGGRGGDGTLIISYPTVTLNTGNTLAVDLDATYTLGATDRSVIFNFSSKLTRPTSGWNNNDLIAAEVAITSGSGADDAPVFRGAGNCQVDLSNDATEYGFGDTQANGERSINGYSVFVLNDRSPQMSVQGTVAAVVNVLQAVKISCDSTSALAGKYVRVGAVPTVGSSSCSGNAIVNGSTSGTLSCGELYYVFSTKRYYRIGTVSTSRSLTHLFATARTMSIPVDGTHKTGATMYGWVSTLKTRDEIILTNAIGDGVRMIGTTDDAQTWTWDSRWGTPQVSPCTTQSGAFKWLGPDAWCELVPTWNHVGTTTYGSSTRYWKLDPQTNLWGFGTNTDFTIDLGLSAAPSSSTDAGAVGTNGYGVYHSWHREASGITEPNDTGTFAWQGYSGSSGEPGWDDANDTGATKFYAEFCSGTSGNTCTPPDGAVDSTLLRFSQTTVRYAAVLPVDPRATKYTATNFSITGGSAFVIACINPANSSGNISSGVLTFDVSNTTDGSAADTQYQLIVNGTVFTITITGDKTDSLVFYGLRAGVADLVRKVAITKASGNFSSAQYVKFRTGPWYENGPTNCNTSTDVDTDQIFELTPLSLTQKRSASVTIKKGGPS